MKPGSLLPLLSLVLLVAPLAPRGECRPDSELVLAGEPAGPCGGGTAGADGLRGLLRPQRLDRSAEPLPLTPRSGRGRGVGAGLWRRVQTGPSPLPGRGESLL